MVSNKGFQYNASWAYSLKVEHVAHNDAVVGSSPAKPRGVDLSYPQPKANNKEITFPLFGTLLTQDKCIGAPESWGL